VFPLRLIADGIFNPLERIAQGKLDGDIHDGEAGRALLVIPDQHSVGRLRATGEGQAAIVRPIEIENLVRSEMRYGLRWAAARRLFPDIIHPITLLMKEMARPSGVQ